MLAMLDSTLSLSTLNRGNAANLELLFFPRVNLDTCGLHIINPELIFNLGNEYLLKISELDERSIKRKEKN